MKHNRKRRPFANLRRGIEQPCLTPLTLPRTKGTDASSQRRKGHWTKNADPVYSFRLKHKTRDNNHSNKSDFCTPRTNQKHTRNSNSVDNYSSISVLPIYGTHERLLGHLPGPEGGHWKRRAQKSYSSGLSTALKRRSTVTGVPRS